MSGLGFGIMSGVFSFVNTLSDSLGPGTVGIHGDSPQFFLNSGRCLVTVNVQASGLNDHFLLGVPWLRNSSE